jgi:hypothetical protein
MKWHRRVFAVALSSVALSNALVAQASAADKIEVKAATTTLAKMLPGQQGWR